MKVKHIGAAVAVACAALCVQAKVFVDISSSPVVQVRTAAVAGEAVSLLPPGKKWKLVWHDEFNGPEIDRTKWMCRESFWGADFPAFAHGFEGVEMTGRSVKLHLLRKGDDFSSPHLQTGSLTYDIPKDGSGFWPFGSYRKPLFMHRYGYYEIRCRQPKYPGWHSAFWLQAPGVGSSPNPGECGVETDIMENYRQFTEGRIVGGNLWNGYGKDGRGFGHFEWKYEEYEDGWCHYGVDWSPKGYTFYANGKKIGEQNEPVSHVEQFILVSTEPRGYRNVGGNDGGLTDGQRTWGKPDPRLFDVVLPDFFEVDFVRVYDAVEDDGSCGKAPAPGKMEVVIEASSGGDPVVGFVKKELLRVLKGVEGRIVLREEKGLKPQEWRLRSEGDGTLVISGRDGMGIAYGVFTFLEKHAGAAWYAPDTEVLPNLRGWKLPRLDETGAPAFLDREMYVGTDYMDTTWRLRNKETRRAAYGVGRRYGKPGSCHTFAAYAKALKDAHPELFGKRPAANGRVCRTLCLTDPVTREFVAEEMCRYIERDAEAARKAGDPSYTVPSIYEISQDDGGSSAECMCERCKAFAEAEGGYSGPMIDFASDVARRVGKRHPEVAVQTYAYSYTMKPPKTVKGADNLFVRYCDSHVFAPLIRGTPPGDALEEWMRHAANISVWGYWRNYTGKPLPMMKSVADIGAELRFVRDCNVKNYMAEDESPLSRSFAMLQHWLFLKLTENPDQDEQALARRFMSAYYGAAARPMTQFREYLERRQEPTFTYLDREFFEKANAWLDEAERLAAGDARSLGHVRWERVVVDRGAFLTFADTRRQGYRMDVKAVAARLKENHRELLKGWGALGAGGKGTRERRLKAADDEAMIYANYPVAIPERFAGKTVVDRLSIDQAPRMAKLVEDPDAAAGYAFYIPPTKAELPFSFGFYHAESKSQGEVRFKTREDVPQDEKFHLYHVGRSAVLKGFYVWFDPTWRYRCWEKTIGIVPEEWDVWVSAKFTGPAFVEGSKSENRVLFDRVLFVKPGEAAAKPPAGGAEGAARFAPLVPVMLGVERPDMLAGDLRRMRDEFGFRRFVLVGPDVRRTFGRADIACFEGIGREIAAVKASLADTDVKIGWWCDPTFHAADGEPWQRIMDCDGNVTGSVCPLDEGHAADFANKLCTGLRIARPDPIFIEDDFTLSNHGGMNAMKGCFCPLHMKSYERKTGRAFTPAEVAAMFRRPTRENEPLRQAWADMSRESLVWFARYVRREIDKVAPETRVCLCQSGFVDVDGDSTEAVTRAWAGGTRPLVRLFGAGYWDESPPMNVAANIAHVFWSAQHLPSDFEMLHETDAYPHTRFYNSSLFLVSEFAGALMAGVHSPYYYCLQYTDDPLSDIGYAKRMRDFSRRFETVRRLRDGARPVGVRMVYTPKEAYMVRETTRPASCGMLTASTVFLAKLGFPIVTREDAPVATLFGSTPNVLSDGEIRELLKGGLFLDGEAADILTKRGFADLIGAEAVDDVETKIQFASERILPPAKSTFRGSGVFTRRRKSKPIIGWTRKRSVFASLKPKPGATVWSAYCDVDGKEVAPAVIAYDNALGGRIGVMAQSVDVKPPHMSLFTPRKQELFHNLFVHLSGDAIAVRAPKTPNTFVLASESGGDLLVMVNNLAGEPRDDVRLEFSAPWAGLPVERLTPDGIWSPLAADYVFEPLVPEFLRVKSDGKRLAAEDLALVPAPRKIDVGSGVFRCRTSDIATRMKFERDASIPREGYRLEVAPDAIRAWSSDDAGAFYAVRTVEQLARKTYVPDSQFAAVKKRESDYEIPCVRIEDAPEFRWRGLMIDEARHFLGKEAVMRQIDLMADHKLNVFHWHLVDDQGWRLDLPRHPELVKYGAVRPCSVAYGAGAEWYGKEQTLGYRLNSEKYGPYFYSPEDVREIREYAKARHVTIVPEIEIPGHERALLAARPDLSCRGEAIGRTPRTYWSIERDVLCAGNGETVTYLEGVFDEVCDLFPDSPYIHIGGDECPKSRWKECAKCQGRMKEIGAKDERDLQAWFTRHFAEYLGRKGRRVVGWDEVLHGDVPQGVIGMSWRMSASGGVGGDFVSASEAAAKGHDMVLTPSHYCYFSRRQGLSRDPFPYYEPEPFAEQKQRIVLTVEKAYSFDPYAGIPEKLRGRILGVQASVWTESIFSRFDFEWKAWPRTCALAEIAWTGPGARTFTDFRARMVRHRERLISRRVNCAPLD